MQTNGIIAVRTLKVGTIYYSHHTYTYKNLKNGKLYKSPHYIELFEII